MAVDGAVARTCSQMSDSIFAGLDLPGTVAEDLAVRWGLQDGYHPVLLSPAAALAICHTVVLVQDEAWGR